MSISDLAAQRQDGAVARAGDLQVAFRLARMVHRHQVLAPVLGPLDRTADVARRERNQEILGIELAARTEAAADVVLDHLDGVFGKPDLLGEDAPVEERHLGGARDREPARVPHPTRASTPRGSIGSAVWRWVRKLSRRT